MRRGDRVTRGSRGRDRSRLADLSGGRVRSHRQRAGWSDPQLTPRELVRPIMVLLAVLTAVVFLTGYTVWRHAELFEV